MGCGRRKTLDEQKRYIKSDKTWLLPVSRVAMRLPKALAPDVRTECGPAVTPTVSAGEYTPHDVVGVPKDAFSLS
jgi:hypothetical protein